MVKTSVNSQKIKNISQSKFFKKLIQFVEKIVLQDLDKCNFSKIEDEANIKKYNTVNQLLKETNSYVPDQAKTAN